MEGICSIPMLYLASPWLGTIDSALLYNHNNKQLRRGRGVCSRRNDNGKLILVPSVSQRGGGRRVKGGGQLRVPFQYY